METDTRVQQKAAVRKAVLDQRKSRTPQTRAAHSEAIIRALLNLEEYRAAKAILVYLSKDEEVATDELPARAFEAGKRVFVPVVIPESEELGISALPGPGARLQPGPFGVRQPVEGELNFVSPDAIDLVVVPGVAFDRKGGRLGYGKGYYDRLLRRLKANVPKVALAFDFQVLDAVPQNEGDIRIDIIITENTTMNCSGI